MIDPACSFCGKKQREVSRLLANGEAMICDECVQHCVEVIVRDPTRPGTGSGLRDSNAELSVRNLSLLHSLRIWFHSELPARKFSQRPVAQVESREDC